MYFSAGKRMSYKGEIVNYGDPDDLKPGGSGFNHIAIPTIIHIVLIYIYFVFFFISGFEVSFVQQITLPSEIIAKFIITIVTKYMYYILLYFVSNDLTFYICMLLNDQKNIFLIIFLHRCGLIFLI